MLNKPAVNILSCDAVFIADVEICMGVPVVGLELLIPFASGVRPWMFVPLGYFNTTPVDKLPLFYDAVPTTYVVSNRI